MRSQDVNDPNNTLDTINIDLTEQGNPSFDLPIATGLPASSNGQYAWLIPNSITPAADYVMKVTRVATGGNFFGASLAPFTISAPQFAYYVADPNKLTHDSSDWTTVPGNDANSGLDPAHPKASIAAVLNAYPNIGAGATIYVDDGNYTLSTNIVIAAANSGLTIDGYNSLIAPPTFAGTADPQRQAVLNRGNTSSGSDVIQMAGATGVTLQYLQLTGGQRGLTGTGANNLLVSNCQIYGNSQYGVYFDSSSSGVDLTGNTVHDNSSEDIYLLGTNAVVTGNTTYNSSYGIDVEGAGGTISGNTAYGDSSYGIYASGGSSGSPIIVSGNTVSANGNGILATGGYVQATSNTAYNNTGIGIYVYNSSNAQASQNVVHDNGVGIQAYSGGTVSNNRVYHNVNQGILVYYGNNASVLGNTVYSNSIGIQEYYYGTIANNLVYANANEGIELTGTYSTGAQVTNNTVYQPVGDAVLVQSSSQNVTLRNNILWVLAGYDLNVAADSQVGFNSDYNDLFTTVTGKVAHWQGTDFATQADWFYRVGQDPHSFSADPQFVNPPGADGILGYSQAPLRRR